MTIVEFFDPACKACRAFYPVVKDLLKQYPQDVRLVLRYAPFHSGSDKVVCLLEAAKRQDKYWPVLEALLTTQPMWADHNRPSIELAYQSAQQAGLDLEKARADAATPEMDALLQQEIQDLVGLKIKEGAHLRRQRRSAAELRSRATVHVGGRKSGRGPKIGSNQVMAVFHFVGEP